MACILNIDTTTKLCSVAVAIDGKQLSLVEENSDQFIHSEKLHVFIDEALSKAGKSVQGLDAIAVSKGPGSYTGLRIGVSAAKGLAYAHDLPLIAVDTLGAMANSVFNMEKVGVYIPMLDARRMEVYCSVFNNNGELLRDTQASIIDEQSFSDFNETVYFFGEGAEKCRTVLPEKFKFIPNVITSALNMIPVSHTKFVKQEFEDVAYFEPYYLKDFVAGKPKKLL